MEETITVNTPLIESEKRMNITESEPKIKVVRKLKPIEERIKKREQIAEKEFNVKIEKPDIKADKTSNISSIEITAQSLNILVNMTTSAASTLLNKESVTPEETVNFSNALYEVGKIHGWFKNIQFLPYLILLAAGADLSLKILSKPDRAKKVKEKNGEKEKEKAEEIVRTFEKSTPDIKEQIDIINQDELTKKIMGGIKK